MAGASTRVDENTGREIRQLTDLPQGASLSYFRFPRHLSDGRVMAFGRHEAGNVLAIDAESGRVERLPILAEGCTARLSADGRVLWLLKQAEREVWAVRTPHGRPERIATVPAGMPGIFTDITCDGRALVAREVNHDLSKYPLPTVPDPAAYWHYVNRPRTGGIWALDLPTGEFRKILHTDGAAPDHLDCSPAEPRLLRYCLEHCEVYNQRVWSIRIDGSDRRMIRPQEPGEMVTHEFWWPGGQFVGFTYQDRRGDETVHDIPLAEYAPRPTRFGLADLSGREVYLSDPLNHYHTHLYASPDGRLVSGEGTDGHFRVYAAPFSLNDRRIAFVELATVHTPYIPFRGNNVECGFSADGRWLMYNDTVAGKFQVCAVGAEV